jgi:hypothetical protein
MPNQAVQATTNSFPLAGLLGVAFVVLKLCKVIDWSWWWVTAPFWGPVALVLGICVVIFGFAGIVALGAGITRALSR